MRNGKQIEKKEKTKQKIKQNVNQAFVLGILILPGIFVIFPVIILITGSFMDQYELKEYLSPIFMENLSYVSWKLMPDYPSFGNYKKLLFQDPSFFILFWNSIRMTACILGGQLLAGVPAAWAFAVYKGRAGKILFAFYVVLMLLPFQVTMLSNYLVLNKLFLLNTQKAVILPAIFSTFPIFLCYGGFRSIPVQLFEAARVDGAREWNIFLQIGLPLGKTGILSAIVLGALEYWNMMEQPMAFIDDKSMWPLSLYLPEITWAKAGYAFCASFITLIPAIFVFAMGQDYLEQGIVYSGLKE